MLPVVTGRFLFSQAPDLLLPMWKQGQLQPGWLPAGRPDSAQRGLSGPATLGPRPVSEWPELPPTLGPHFSYPQQLLPRGRGHAWLPFKAKQMAQEVRSPGVRARGFGLSSVLHSPNAFDHP